MASLSESPPPSTVFQPGKVAVITGASSGIGKAVARRCANLKMKVVLADIDAGDLEEARQEVAALADSASDVLAVPTDVADPAALVALQQKTFHTFGGCHFLMNNAGTGVGGGVQAPLSTWSGTMGVNFMGPIHGCQAFVGPMQEFLKAGGGSEGLIVNTGSKQGITMPPGNLVYNCSKAALKCFTEGLEHDLRTQHAKNKDDTPRIRAALLVPGWVNTSIALKTKRAEMKAGGAAAEELSNERLREETFFHEAKPAAGAWMPDQVVTFMLEQLALGRFYIICPDNDVDRQTDNLRMTWAMQDITMDRPPLSRWHDAHSPAFTAFLEENRK